MEIETNNQENLWEKIQSLDFLLAFDKQKSELYKQKLQQFKSDDFFSKLVEQSDSANQIDDKEKSTSSANILEEKFNNVFLSNVRKSYMNIMNQWIEQNRQYSQVQEDCIELIKLIFWAANEKILNVLGAFKFIEDIFESYPQSHIRELFELMEEQLLKIHGLYSVENKKIRSQINDQILKLSNIIIKKLSRTQDVDLRGRLHVFLTKILPIVHPSGRNQKSEINPNNFTLIEEMDVEFIKEQLLKQRDQQSQQQSGGSSLQKMKKRSQVDLHLLYNKFWGLQKYFHKPILIFDGKNDDDLFQLQKLEEQLNEELESQKNEQKKSTQNEQQEQANSKQEIENEKDDKNKKNSSKESKSKDQKKSNEEDKKSQKMEVLKIKEICSSMGQIIDYFKANAINDSGNTANQRYPKFLTTKSLLEIQCVALMNEAEQKVKLGLENICKLLKEQNMVEQLDKFIQQEQMWSGWKKQWSNSRQDEFFQKPQVSEITKAIEFYKQIQQKIESKEDLNGIERDIYGTPVNFYCKKANEKLENTLQSIRNDRKNQQVAKPDSQIKNIFKTDGYVFTIPTDPLEDLPSVNLDKVYREMKTGVYDDELGPLKNQENFTWKTLRRVARFDISILKNKSQKDDLMNIEDIAEQVLKVHGEKNDIPVANNASSQSLKRKRSPSQNQVQTEGEGKGAEVVEKHGGEGQENNLRKSEAKQKKNKKLKKENKEKEEGEEDDDEEEEDEEEEEEDDDEEEDEEEEEEDDDQKEQQIEQESEQKQKSQNNSAQKLMENNSKEGETETIEKKNLEKEYGELIRADLARKHHNQLTRLASLIKYLSSKDANKNKTKLFDNNQGKQNAVDEIELEDECHFGIDCEELYEIKQCIFILSTSFEGMKQRKELSVYQTKFNLHLEKLMVALESAVVKKEQKSQQQQLPQENIQENQNGDHLKDLLINNYEKFVDLLQTDICIDYAKGIDIIEQIKALLSILEVFLAKKKKLKEKVHALFYDNTMGSIDQFRVEMENHYKSQRFQLESFDGKKIDCMFIPCPEEFKPKNKLQQLNIPLELAEKQQILNINDSVGPTLLYCNPNAGFYEFLFYDSDWIEFYMRLGINIVLWNYRGYGKSQGHPCPHKIAKDGEILIDYLRNHYKVKTLGLHGQSLGGIFASHLAQKKEADFLLADRTLGLFSDVATYSLGRVCKILFKLIVNWDISSGSNFTSSKCFKVIAYDPRDQIIPYMASLKNHTAKMQLVKYLQRRNTVLNQQQQVINLENIEDDFRYNNAEGRNRNYLKSMSRYCTSKFVSLKKYCKDTWTEDFSVREGATLLLNEKEQVATFFALQRIMDVVKEVANWKDKVKVLQYESLYKGTPPPKLKFQLQNFIMLNDLEEQEEKKKNPEDALQYQQQDTDIHMSEKSPKYSNYNQQAFSTDSGTNDRIFETSPSQASTSLNDTKENIIPMNSERIGSDENLIGDRNLTYKAQIKLQEQKDLLPHLGEELKSSEDFPKLRSQSLPTVRPRGCRRSIFVRHIYFVLQLIASTFLSNSSLISRSMDQTTPGEQQKIT